MNIATTVVVVVVVVNRRHRRRRRRCHVFCCFSSKKKEFNHAYRARVPWFCQKGKKLIRCVAKKDEKAKKILFMNRRKKDEVEKRRKY